MMAATTLPDSVQNDSIYSQAGKCEQLFYQYMAEEREYKREVSRCHSRFLTWASFLGVFARESVSLDRRLQVEPEIKELTLSMLGVLEINLQHGIGKHRLVNAKSNYGSPQTASTGMERDGGDSIMFGITGAIDRLERLAKVIRHAPRSDEIERVRNFAAKQDAESEARFSRFVSSTLRFIFPKAKETLRTQLAESVIYRRHRLLYNRRHSKKLARQRRDEATLIPAKRTGAKAPVSNTTPHWNPQIDQNKGGSTFNKTDKTYSTSVHSHRPIGAILTPQQRSLRHDNKKKTASETGSSILPTARYPSRPKATAGTTEVQCPYCLSQVQISSGMGEGEEDTLWVKHLNEDLLPYVCVAEDCGTLPPAYSSVKAWETHMKNAHGTEWSRLVHMISWQCKECGENQKPFLTRDLLIRHLAEDQVKQNASKRSAVEIAEIAAKGKKSDPRSRDQCPLCAAKPPWYNPWTVTNSTQPDASKTSEEAENNLQKHFAAHLRDLAFYSIRQWGIDTGVDVDLEDGSETSALVGFNSQVGKADKLMQDGELPFLDEEELNESRLDQAKKEQDGQDLHILITARELNARDLAPLSSQFQPRSPPDPPIYEPSIEPFYIDADTSVELFREVRYGMLQNDLREAKKRALDQSSPEGDLENEIFDQLVNSAFTPGTQLFMPEGHIHKVVTPDAIVQELTTLDPESLEDLKLFGYIQYEAKKIFAISILSGFRGIHLMNVMRRFLGNDGFNDTSLPVLHPQPDGQDGNTKILFAEPWNNSRRDSFFRMQWRFLSPIFLSFRSTMLDLDPNCILPFTFLSNRTRMGAFARVSEAEIHPNHLDTVLPALGSHLAKHAEGVRSRIAIKEMIEVEDEPRAGQGTSGWEDEAAILANVAEIHHPHIIKFIAAVKIDNRRYIMFEWADGGNLRDIWASSPTAHDLSSKLVRETLMEIAGLADAVCKLHEMGIRHGDLKPENILSVTQNSTSLGRLKIADLGLAKKHTTLTRLRNFVTTTRFGTVRYEPPEVALSSRPISRLYDIWSMGCIILEWIICLLYGYNELRMLNAALQDESLRPTGFFEVSGTRTTRRSAHIHPAITKVMDQLEMDSECRGNTAFSHLLRLVKDRLLVVDLPNEEQSDVWSLEEPTNPPILVVNADYIIPRTRATAVELRDSLNDILRMAEQDEAFLFSGNTSEIRSLNLGLSTSETGLLEPLTVTATQKTDPGPPASRIEDYSRFFFDGWRFIIDNDFGRQVITSADFHVLSAGRAPQPLCSRCQSLDFWKPTFAIKDDISNLKEKAQRCELCARLLAACVAVTEGAVVFRRDLSTILLNESALPVLSIVATGDPKKLSPTQIGLPALPKAGSELHFSIAREWLKKCDMEHEICMKERPTIFVPTRLIDVTGVDSTWVHLHETSPGESVRYLALSHLWGQGQFVTRSSNIQQHLERINIEDLPPTIRDAVITTRALGIPYLWIDSICIIQGADGDFNIEAERFEHVFHNAYCVIAATQSVSCQTGFLTQVPQRDFVRVNRDEKSSLYVCSFIDKFDTDVLQRPLHQRAWVLQDRVFARRTIYFAEGQTYWECGDGIRCETLTKMHSEVEALLGGPNFPAATISSKKAFNTFIFQDLFSRYSRMELTHHRDRPIAIDGIQERLSVALGRRAAWGVFDSPGLLHRGILWKRAEVVETLREIYFGPESQPPPSWSWTGLDGEISYLDAPLNEVEWDPDVRLDGKDELNGMVQDFLQPSNSRNTPVLILDRPDEEINSSSLRCFVVGKIKELPKKIEPTLCSLSF